MKVKGMLIGMLALSATASPVPAQVNAAFGAYLVDTVELRLGFGTVLQVVNPTTAQLDVVGALYDRQGGFVTCGVTSLKPDGLIEVPVWWLAPPQDDDPSFVGVAKIVSFKKYGEGEYSPVEGIIGFQWHCNLKFGCSDGNLAALPNAIAAQELVKIVGDCPLL